MRSRIEPAAVGDGNELRIDAHVETEMNVSVRRIQRTVDHAHIEILTRAVHDAKRVVNGIDLEPVGSAVGERRAEWPADQRADAGARLDPIDAALVGPGSIAN